MKKLCLLVLVLGATALFAAYPDEYPSYLRLLGYSKDEIRDLKDCPRPVVHSIPSQRPGEFGITAARVFDVPGYFIRDYYSYVENFRSLREFRAVGKFKEEPELQDLLPLQMDATELQEFASCASSCGLHITREEAGAIQQTSNLEDLYRKILLGRLQDYRRNGNPSDTYLKSFPHLPAYFPRVLDYVSVYPASKDRRIPEFFYWAKEEIGGRNIIQIRHVFTQRIQEDFVMVDHLIYSSHSLVSSAYVLHLVNYVDDGYPRTLLVFYGRNYGDSENRSASSNKRVFSAFRKAGEELEERYLSRVYPGFPYGLTPSDQR